MILSMSRRALWLGLHGLVVFVFIAASVPGSRAADDLADVFSVPRIEGATEEPARALTNMLVYSVAGPVPENMRVIRDMFSKDGWIQFNVPLEKTDATHLLMKKGPQIVSVSALVAGVKGDRSRLTYYPIRVNVDLPVPTDGIDVIFDGNRPYLNYSSTGPRQAKFESIEQTLISAGWAQLSAPEASGRWPNAQLEASNDTRSVAYYSRGDRPAIVLSVVVLKEDKLSVEIKIAPFLLPQSLEVGDDSFGLITPKLITSAARTNGETRRELNATVPVELATVLAFYRNEMNRRGWKEQTPSAPQSQNEIVLAFKSLEETAVLRVGHKYDLTVVNMIAEVQPSVLAARAKARKDQSDKFMQDAEALARSVIASSDKKKNEAAPAQSDSSEVLRPKIDKTIPVPLPETADGVVFDGVDGNLKFTTSSSVASLAAFYRVQLKSLGWSEKPSVINRPNMVVLELSNKKRALSFTIMQMGSKVNVSASGDGLKSIAAVAAKEPAAAPLSAKLEIADIEAEDGDAILPVPREHTLRSPSTVSKQGTQAPFRRQMDASVPASLMSVLTFYRRELAARQWKELPQGAVVTAEKVVLAFSSPDGPATLKLGRENNETLVSLAQKIPAAAQQAGIAPAAGQVKLIFGNLGEAEAEITINKKAIKIAAGVGSPKTPDGPTLEVPPGKYTYTLKIAGRSVPGGQVIAEANDAWGLLIGPGRGGVLLLQMY